VPEHGERIRQFSDNLPQISFSISDLDPPGNSLWNYHGGAKTFMVISDYFSLMGSLLLMSLKYLLLIPIRKIIITSELFVTPGDLPFR
jgi:hypothetical protein